MRPATASLVSGGTASLPSSSSEASLWASRSSPASLRCSGQLVSEDLERALDAGTCGDRGTGRTAQVRVVEVGEAVRGATHLAPDPALLPEQHRLVRSEAGQHRADRVPVADHHAVHAAHLTRLRGDAQPTGGADERQRGLRPRAGDLERRRATGLGQRAVREERATPGGLGLGHAGGHHLGRQAADRATPVVQQTGLTGERLPVLDHPDDVPAAAAQTTTRHDDDLALVPVDLRDRLPEPTGSDARVQLRLDHDPTRDDVQAAREPQGCRDLGLP